MSPSASMPISCCRPQTPHTFNACQISLNSALFAGVAGFTTSFLKLYSWQCSQACARAIRSARSRVITFANSLLPAYLSFDPDGDEPAILEPEEPSEMDLNGARGADGVWGVWCVRATARAAPAGVL